jgi:hypothetical protein
MKTLIILGATAVALASATLGSTPASAKDPPPGVTCQKMRRVAVGKHHSKEIRALNECKLKLREKGEAIYGANYWGYTDFSSGCAELGVPDSPNDKYDDKDYWQCICSAYICGWSKLQIIPPPQSFKRKPDRDPKFRPTPGHYLDMPKPGRFLGMPGGISRLHPQR